MKRLITFVLTSLLLALVAAPAGAITYGQVDEENRYPFVPLLAFYEDGEYSHRCSGTLMSSTVIVTASHCTIGMDQAYAFFVVEVPDDFRDGPDEAEDAGGVPGTPHTNPAYNPLTLRNDVSVVVLDETVNLGVTLPVLADEGFLTEMKAEGEIKDDEFRAVGYGGSETPGSPPPILTFDLKRRFVDSPYAGLTHNNLHLQQNPVPTGQGGTCGGDSGGPRFWEDTLILVAVTSWGDPICRANDMTQRVDIEPVLDFLADHGLTPPA